ncbi:MAG: TonB-dependent receptor [Bacteroidales bacterium]
MRKLSVVILFLISSFLASGQDKSLSLSFSRILFKNLADTVEKTVPVRLYFADSWVDTLYLKVDSRGDSLGGLFSKSLANSGLNFIITDDRKLIFSKGYSIKTNFNKEYREYLMKSLLRPDTTTYILPQQKAEDASINEEYKVFKIGTPSSANSNGFATLSGFVTNAENKEALPGVIVYVEKIKAGAITNNVGYYSIEVPVGQCQVEYRMIGMKTTRRNVVIYSSGGLNLSLLSNTTNLNEVVVSANRENNVRNEKIGIEKISLRMLKQIPMGLGETDLLKSSLLLPGVTTVSEASSGFNVRGGSTDQNLILLDYAPIINPTHFFGFFSAFNSDIIQDVTLYKSGIPAKFGGRISSVMDIALKDGSRDKLNISGGVSPFMARLMVETPLFRKKGSLILSGRSTFSDWLLTLLKDAKLKRSSASFYDLQGLFTYDLNKKNSISLSGYISNDNFDYYKTTGVSYSNFSSTLKWKHIYNQYLSSQVSAIISNYNYIVDTKSDSLYSSTLKYKLDQKIFRADFSWHRWENHRIEFGANAIYYYLQPGTKDPYGKFSRIIHSELEPERALEPSLYISDEFDVTPRLLISGGLRFNYFTMFGPGTQLVYRANTPRSTENIIDTIKFSSGQAVVRYPGLEYRISARFIITPEFSVKAGLHSNYQYLNMISNTTSMSPTDIWKLSDSYIRPQKGIQASLGLYRNINVHSLELSVEGYYKNISNVLDYKGGANLIMNDHLETDMINGTGRAYGAELMLKKQYGKLSGWISYTYSRVFYKVNGRFNEEKINGGNWFPANFDKPHDLKIVANLKLTRRLNATSNFVYNTGRPITFPVAYYDFYNVSRVFYSDRNEFRIPDYMRLDFSVTMNGNLKVRKMNHSSLTITAYNVLGRKNPYSIFFGVEDGEVKGYQMSIFGRPVIMFTYSFKIRGNASTDF